MRLNLVSFALKVSWVIEEKHCKIAKAALTSKYWTLLARGAPCKDKSCVFGHCPNSFVHVTILRASSGPVRNGKIGKRCTRVSRSSIYIQIGIYWESDATTSCMQLFWAVRYSKLSAIKKSFTQPIQIFVVEFLCKTTNNICFKVADKFFFVSLTSFHRHISQIGGQHSCMDTFLPLILGEMVKPYSEANCPPTILEWNALWIPPIPSESNDWM